MHALVVRHTLDAISHDCIESIHGERGFGGGNHVLEKRLLGSEDVPEARDTKADSCALGALERELRRGREEERRGGWGDGGFGASSIRRRFAPPPRGSWLPQEPPSAPGGSRRETRQSRREAFCARRKGLGDAS